MNKAKRFPSFYVILLAVIAIACAMAGILSPYEPSYMDTGCIGQGPCSAHILGTDSMGRDLLTMLLYGGRSSVYIGILSGVVSTSIAVIYGTVCGIVSEEYGDMMMRFSELMMSIPSMLLVIFLQAIWGQPTETSLAVIIGMCSWMNISKIIRSDVRQIRQSDYILAARLMKAGFWYTLRRHFLPGFISSIMFMVVTNIGQAMITEATLSFLGIGLPLSKVSWGSLMSMSESALLSGKWHLTIIPGTVLVVTLMCITEIGEYVRCRNNRLHSNL